MTDTSDAIGPEIAKAAPDLLAEKAESPWPRMAALALLAGAFIAFGSIAFLIAQSVPGGPTGPVQLLSGVAFSVGLLMVMVAGAELFTGNTMFVLPVARGRLSAGRMAGAWALVWFGNLLASLGIAWLFFAAGGTDAMDGVVGEAARRVAGDKLAKGAGAVFASAILANMLVCLGVWMSMEARTVTAKAVAVVAPVAVFVAAGFEHSIANMSLLPIGLLAGAPGELSAVLLNLVVSTLGNIVGGAAIALALAYGHGGGDS